MFRSSSHSVILQASAGLRTAGMLATVLYAGGCSAATDLFDLFVEVVDQKAGAGCSSTGCVGFKLGCSDMQHRQQ
jgi:hypothetical protein